MPRGESKDGQRRSRAMKGTQKRDTEKEDSDLEAENVNKIRFYGLS